ncbi:MAG: ATP-binding cassette domain-containing protein, partial [Polyangiales bacterium]
DDTRAPALEEGSRAWPSGSLTARALAVDVGTARVRQGVDFVASAGSAVVVVGPPGSGKSALLEAIAGVRPLRGTLRHAGAPIGPGIGPRHRPIAWVPSAPPVLPGTLAENLAPDAPTDRARIGRARSILRALGDEAIVALADDASLGPRGRKLSSGEAQRLALARALASDLPVLLLDEPTANLDDEGERRAIEVLREAARERALVLVTHRPGPRSLGETVIDLGGEDVVGAPESERRIA